MTADGLPPAQDVVEDVLAAARSGHDQCVAIVEDNRDRFPEDFMFQLTAEEVERSRSQIATLNSGRGQNIKYRPYAFTEHGVIMAAILSAIRELMHPRPAKRRAIGFTADLSSKK